MKRIFFCLLICMGINSYAQLRHPLRDSNGRHEVPRGFVVITNDRMGNVYYTMSDYQRMARLGANCQVIRLEPDKVLSEKNHSTDHDYLLRLDSLVEMGKLNGMKTVMKMTVYGIKGFTWEKFWNKRTGMQNLHIERWKVLWNRYKDNPYVHGYDLLNEPRKMSMDISYDGLTEKYLIPYYERMIDEAVKFSDSKYFYCQSIFVNKDDQKVKDMQYAPIKKPIDRKNVIFTPHMYQWVEEKVKGVMDGFDNNSKTMGVPMFMGEWGYPTVISADTVLHKQNEYVELYARTAEVFDSLGCGSVKAWFTGNRTMKSDMIGEPFTWSMYQDEKAVGTYERKYIMDIVARPYPQLIAGDIYSFKFDFARRIFKMKVLPDNSKGTSYIYVSADRFYPDGFTVKMSDGSVFCYNPMKNVGLEIVKYGKDFDPGSVLWDYARQRLVILKWPENGQMTELEIVPGLAY